MLYVCVLNAELLNVHLFVLIRSVCRCTESFVASRVPQSTFNLTGGVIIISQNKNMFKFWTLVDATLESGIFS